MISPSPSQNKKMADSGDSTVNLSALQRVDPYIAEIVDSASQVALYKFSANDNEWDKTGVEGTLFIYRRSAAPLYGFIIMNRLSKTNQIEPITKDLELQREDPYLLYRNSKLNIFGIWFYDKADCAKINDMTTSLLQKEKERNRAQQRVRRASESDSSGDRLAEETQPSGVDILSMLSRAQDVYSKNKSGPADGVVKNPEPKPIIASSNAGTVGSSELIRPKAVRMSGGAPDVTLISPHAAEVETQTKPLTVEALFASATKGQAIVGTDILLGPRSSDSSRQVLTGPLPTMPHVTSSVGVPTLSSAPATTISGGAAIGGGASNPLLQRLMSNPENLVEHIERRQRNEASASSRSLTSTASATTTATTEDMVRELQETLLLVATSAPNSRTTTSDICLSDSVPLISDKLLSTPSGMATVLTPAMLQSMPTATTAAAILNSSTPNVISNSGGMLPALQSPSIHDGMNIPFMFATPPRAPANPIMPLMSPMMFTTRVSIADLNLATPPVSSRLSSGFFHGGDGGSGGIAPPEISPLTKAQLTQAFSYLLRNDPNFVTKLHEAYIMSLNQMTSSHKT